MSLIWRAEPISTIQQAAEAAVLNGCTELLHGGRLFKVAYDVSLTQTDTLEEYRPVLPPAVVAPKPPMPEPSAKPKTTPTGRRWDQKARTADAVNRLLKDRPLSDRIATHLETEGRSAANAIAKALTADRDAVDGALLDKKRFEQDGAGFWGLVGQRDS